MTGATIKRDLRTGRSLWADSPGLGVKTGPLTQAVAVDVAIVGAGISGAFMAHELARDHSVAVLDRRPPLRGSTLASTAMLQWEIDLTLTDLTRAIGAEKARRAYRRSRAAVDDLKRIVAPASQAGSHGDSRIWHDADRRIPKPASCHSPQLVVRIKPDLQRHRPHRVQRHHQTTLLEVFFDQRLRQPGHASSVQSKGSKR